MSAPPALDVESALNPEQQAAVTHGDGPQLVLAGAGSGKTRVITYRVAWLIRELGVEPWRVGAVTFTNKAANEMRERVARLLGGEPDGLYVGTFHRFALRLLRRHGARIGLSPGFLVLDADDQVATMKRALAAEQLAESAFPPRAMLARVSAAKNRLIEPDAYEAQATDFIERRVAVLYRRYQGMLRQAAAVDFDDLINLAVQLHDDAEIGPRLRHRYRYLMVDEFQDTNHAQLELIRAVVSGGGHLTAVGDEDQGIYRWRGAELENILDFERGFTGATIRKLERNYRSTQNILDAAGALVANNQRRRGKRLWTDAGPGELLELYRAADETDEARWLVAALSEHRPRVSWSNMAVLVRTNAQTRALEDELLRQRIPYCLVAGVRFYDRAEIKDAIAYLRVLQHPQDNLALGRILNQPPRGIGKATRDLLEEEARGLGHSLWDALRLGRLAQVPARGQQALGRFQCLIEELQTAACKLPLPELLNEVLTRTGYAKLYLEDDPQGAARLENLDELLSAAQELVEREGRLEQPAIDDEGAGPLIAFLDHVALVSDIDGLDREKGISLMTLHSAKGLEFEVVAIAGLEDGLLPHFNAGPSAEEQEEERRLLYVGMTRAERRLLLSTCRRRRVAGRYQDRDESPFLAEVPTELVSVQQSPSLFVSDRTHAVRRFFSTEAEALWPESPAAVGDLRQGRRVRHATLGEGVVLEVDGDGDAAKITVFFTRGGKKRLVARHAALELIG